MHFVYRAQHAQTRAACAATTWHKSINHATKYARTVLLLQGFAVQCRLTPEELAAS